MTLQITWVHEPKYQTPPPSGTMLVAGAERYAGFITALEHMTRTKICVVTGLLHEVAPALGIVLFQPRRDLAASFDGCPSEARTELASRCIGVFSASPMSVVDQAAQQLRLGGVVDSGCIDAWQREKPNVTPGTALYVRRELAEEIGATCSQPTSSAYCRVGSSLQGLPSLLAAYIGALANSRASDRGLR